MYSPLEVLTDKLITWLRSLNWRKLRSLPVVFMAVLAVMTVGFLGLADFIATSNLSVFTYTYTFNFNIDFPRIKQALNTTGANYGSLFQLAAWILAPTLAVTAVRALATKKTPPSEPAQTVTQTKPETMGTPDVPTEIKRGPRARVSGQDAEDKLNRDALLAATRRQWITLTKLYKTNEITSAFPPTDVPPHLAQLIRRYKIDVILPHGQRYLLEPDKKLKSVVDGTKGWRILTQTRQGQELLTGLLDMELFKELMDDAELNKNAPIPVPVILSAWQNSDSGFGDWVGKYVNYSLGVKQDVLWHLMVKGKIAFIILGKPLNSVFYDSCYEAIRRFWSESLAFCTLSSETERTMRREHKFPVELPADAIMEAYVPQPRFAHIEFKMRQLNNAERDTEQNG